MRSKPSRRPDQTPSAVDAVVGATSPPTAQQTPGAPSEQRSIARTITGAPLKGAGRDEAPEKPEDETPAAQEVSEGEAEVEMEVEMEVELTPEGVEE